jgi:hypothetical protein
MRISNNNEAIMRDAREAAACRERGAAYGQNGELDKAIIEYTEAIRLIS